MASFSNQEIESRGPTVDAAVAAGLLRLGLGLDQVTVIVIDEGSRGLLGIGSREAIVRLATRPPAPDMPPAVPTPKPVVTSSPAPLVPASTEGQSPPAPKPAERRSATLTTAEQGGETTDGNASAELESERAAAIDIIAQLLEKMHVNGQVTGFLTEPDDVSGQRVNMIDISGDDLGVLIGPRGETLDSLQYLSRLMVAHKLHRRANFVIDVEGFRQRREQALTRLAERMADKVRQRGEPISLEPMSAYERRIIHMTLRDATDVYTESAGEGKQRRVRIIPKD